MEGYNRPDNDKNKILIHVDLGSENKEFSGSYQANIKSLSKAPFINNELIFINEETGYCLWQQNNGTWWVGKCENTGIFFGNVYTNDCECPFTTDCSWKTYPNNVDINSECSSKLPYFAFSTGNPCFLRGRRIITGRTFHYLSSAVSFFQIFHFYK